MVAMSSMNPEKKEPLLPQDAIRALLDVAESSIRNGIKHEQPMTVNPDQASERLQRPGASFVSLHRNGQLRGCIGSVVAARPLVQDAAINAFNAAFRDPRFPPLAPEELLGLEIEVSVLSPASTITHEDEGDLLAQLRPNVDGLILEVGPYRGVFLPVVWKQLPDTRIFLQQLKMKAGLPPDYWSPQVQVHRFTTESYSRTIGSDSSSAK